MLFFSLLLSVVQTIAIPVNPIASAAPGDAGSACFDNSSSAAYINMNHANNAVGTGNFTLEMWLKLPSASAALTLVNGHSANNGTSSLNLFFNGQPGGGNSHVAFVPGGVATKWGQIPANTWVHYAYVRTNSTARAYLNGVPSTDASGSQDASVADANNYTSSNFRIGFPLTGAWPAGFTGCLAGVALTKSALYSSNFSTSLPYPGSRTMPANSVIFLEPTSTGFTNTGTGATPSITGSVTYSTDVPSSPPISLSAASISGSAIYNQVLTAVPGTVSNAASYETSYQWRRAGTAISGATNSTYTVTSADIGSAISVVITVSNGVTSDSKTSTATSNVGKATPTFSSWSNVSKNYGDSSFSVTEPTVTGGLPGSFSYTSGTPSVISVSGSTLTVAGAGSSLITATFTPTDTTNYNNATTTMSITVAKASLSITASSHTVAFGDSIPTITPTYSGFVNGENVNVVTGISCSTTYTRTTAVGTTGSTCTGATASNYSFTYTSGVITITQGGQTTPLTVSTTSMTYGSSYSLATSGGSGSGAVSFIVDSGPCTISVATMTATSVGTCMVTATKAANGNYLAASSLSTAITVNPKSLTISGITGVHKEFDGTRTGSVTGTPTLVGVVGSDNVLLGGTPVFTFASANAGNGVTLTASGYTLSESSASNYTLTQPALTANITAKVARIVANNLTVAFGATVTSGVTATGLISPDAVSSASYTYTGTGTSTPPTAVGIYTVTPSSAVFSTGLSGNYSITYDTATLTILAKYTITYNANGGQVSGGSTSTVDYVVGENALSLPTPTRANYTFTGWYTLQTSGTQVVGPYSPTATEILWARWVQNSLYGMGANTKILTITTLADAGNTYSVSAGGGTVAIEYIANALPVGTVIDGYILLDTSTATSVLGSGNDYVMSLVLAWVATDGTVPTTASGKPISMTITNSGIKRGAKIYSVIGNAHTLLGIATVDGSATISITDDPQIIIAITKPDAPTGVTATSGGNASSTVSWTAPSDGGSPISSYTATSNTGQTCSSTTTTCSITGLSNGTTYTFTVTATNSIGTSEPSSPSNSATPSSPAPPAPTVDLRAEAAAVAARELAARELAEKKAAEEAVLKAAQEKIEADAKALALANAEAKAIADAAALKAAQDAADALAKEAALLQAAKDAEIAAVKAADNIKPAVTLYSLTSKLKLNAYDSAYLTRYVKSLKNGASVTCIGYIYSKGTTMQKATTLAKRQASAVCAQMKKTNKTLKTSVVVYPASKAPKAAAGAKWVGVCYRIDGFKTP